MNELRNDETEGDSREREFESLLYYLRQHRGFDFSGYKRPSLMRRVSKRMQMMGVEGFAGYMDYLEVHPEEFQQLFNAVLINVTSFFRDPHAWEFLAKRALPKLLAARGSGEPIRVWCAGCASGEEAYTIAIVLAEALGLDAFRDRVKIYATDVDEDALNLARLASYSAKDLDPLDASLRKKYFEPQSSRWVFRADLRRSVIFGRHDLVQDAPISRLDLLVCRNTIMYFNAETQARILARFHFALNGDGADEAGGCLFLGRAEMLLTHGNLFTPLDIKCRIFAKVPQVDTRNRLLAMANHNNNPQNGAPPPPSSDSERLRELALEESPVARLIVGTDGMLMHANQKVRLLFSLNAKDVGRPFRDLEISYRPVELRSLIEQAYTERRPVTQTAVERWFASGEVQYLDVVVAPLADDAGKAVGVGITFQDVTRYYTLQQELQQSKEEIQTANEELQSSNEELETTNEELQSSNEELETTKRGAAVDQRRARDHERGAAVDERGAADGEFRAARAYRRAASHQRVPRVGVRYAALGRGRRRRQPRHRGLERSRRGPVGPARGRSARQVAAQPRHRAADPAVARLDPRLHLGCVPVRRGRAECHDAARQADSLPRQHPPARRHRAQGRDPADGRGGFPAGVVRSVVRSGPRGSRPHHTARSQWPPASGSGGLRRMARHVRDCTGRGRRVAARARFLFERPGRIWR
ncbi:MAG TPA: CheR family methyltransferase [Burkholderiales bacterium]|nr:CheR family methyltransferase [Burkholderiales bacterium]